MSSTPSSLAIPESPEELELKEKYRPFLNGPEIDSSDWVSQLELDPVFNLAKENQERTGERLKILVLYGSLRSR